MTNQQARTVKMARVNGYVCQKCGEVTYTIDVDDGVTPALLGCKAKAKSSADVGPVRQCLGMALSLCYNVPVDHPEPEWEWFKPSKSLARRQDRRYPGSLEHWRKGGLSLRPRQKVRSSAVASGADEKTGRPS